MALNQSRTSGANIVALPKPDTVGGVRVQYRGLDVAQRIFDNAKSGRSLVYYDPDVDGLVAGFFITQVLNHLGIARRAFANSNRAHGFILNEHDYTGWTVFNGDFLVPRWKVEALVENGVSLLSLDHHELEDEGFIHERGVYEGREVEGVVINNQYEWEDPENHFQSGAGVTFEVLRELYPWMDTPTNRAMVGATLLTDIRNIHNERAAGYLWELYNHKYEGYIKYLIHASGGIKFKFGIPRATRNYIDFNFAPKINSILRFNEEDLGVRYILGGGYPDGDFQARQKDFVKELLKVTEISEYSHLKVLHIKEELLPISARSYYSNFVGLMCSRFSGDGHSVLGYATNAEGKVVRASFRGNLQDTPYREASQGIVDGRGHEIAFGIIGLKAEEEVFLALNAACRSAEENSSYRQRYIEVKNLRDFIKNNGSLLADYNNYRTSSSRVHIRYTGGTAEIAREGAKYTEYLVNGITVMSFDKLLDIDKDYIVVSLNNKQLDFTLQERWNESYSKEIRLGDVELGEDWWKKL